MQGLEAKAGTERYGASGKSVRNRTEVRATNVVRDAVRIQVKVVKDVVGVDPELELGVLAEDGSFRQAETFG